VAEGGDARGFGVSRVMSRGDMIYESRTLFFVLDL